MKKNKKQTKATNKIKSFHTTVTPTIMNNGYFIFNTVKIHGHRISVMEFLHDLNKKPCIGAYVKRNIYKNIADYGITK